MKTHELAKALVVLARAMTRGPNIDIENLNSPRAKKAVPDKDAIPVALSTLVALSRFDKSQWMQVIKEYGFPVSVRDRDASRDVLGKILTHLEESPEARKRLANRAVVSRTETSPELMRALELLLKK